jgi:hypothetical protein
LVSARPICLSTGPSPRQDLRFSGDGAFTSFRNPLPADWSPQRKPKRRGATASRRTPKRPRLAHARDDFGLRRQSVSVDGAFTSFRNPLPADCLLNVSQSGVALPLPAALQNAPGSRMPAAILDCAGRASASTALSLHSATRFQLTCLFIVSQSGVALPLPAALQNAPGSRMPTAALDCAGRASASTALSLHSATRFQLTGLLNVSQSGVALPLPAALQNTPGSRMPTAILDCAGRASASTALSLHSATRFQLTCLLNVSQSGVALSLPAALQNAPGSRMPTAILDCAGRAPASTALSLHSATRFQLTGLLNVSQSGVALPLPAALQNTPGSRMPTAILDCAGRASASTALSLHSATRFQLTASPQLQRKPKRRGATASRRTPKHPRLAHAHG